MKSPIMALKVAVSITSATSPASAMLRPVVPPKVAIAPNRTSQITPKLLTRLRAGIKIGDYRYWRLFTS